MIPSPSQHDGRYNVSPPIARGVLWQGNRLATVGVRPRSLTLHVGESTDPQSSPPIALLRAELGAHYVCRAFWDLARLRRCVRRLRRWGFARRESWWLA